MFRIEKKQQNDSFFMMTIISFIHKCVYFNIFLKVYYFLIFINNHFVIFMLKRKKKLFCFVLILLHNFNYDCFNDYF
jgi:hypothetical protein